MERFLSDSLTVSWWIKRTRCKQVYFEERVRWFHLPVLKRTKDRAFQTWVCLHFSYPCWGNILSISRFEIEIIDEICYNRWELFFIFQHFQTKKNQNLPQIPEILVIWQNLKFGRFNFFPERDKYAGKRFTIRISVTVLFEPSPVKLCGKEMIEKFKNNWVESNQEN